MTQLVFKTKVSHEFACSSSQDMSHATNQHRAHPNKKNSASTFSVSDTLECTM
jgi:hypothetical protein